MMDCRRFLELLHPWLDGELDLVHALEMEAHSDGCAGCLAESAALRDLKTRLSQGALAFPAPPGLAAKVRAALPEAASAPASGETPSRSRRIRRTEPGSAPSARPHAAAHFRPAAAILAAVLLLASSLAFWARKTEPRRDALAMEMIACHVRSLQADHLFDVASTDRHTVKPWFNGKLDFSPPVADFSQDGFPLVGGRLEYLGGHPVSALVYRRRQHILNVFCWPSANGDERGPKPATLQGYRTAFWSRDGFRFGAVSDLNPEEFGHFVELMER